MDKITSPIYKKVDYTNKQMGSWLILGSAKYIPTKSGGRYLWYCRCECGIEKWNSTTSLLYGRSMMCVACRNSDKNGSKEKNPNWKGFGEVPGVVLQRIRQNAQRRGRHIAVEITCECLDAQWKKQGGRCVYTNRELNILKDASVDRIDSLKGYTRDNIEWVHKDVNKAKMALSRKDFLRMVFEIQAHCR